MRKVDGSFITPEPTVCPYCGARMRGHMPHRHDHPPRDGDVSICADCSGVALYAMDATALRLPTDAERADLDADPRVQQAIPLAAEWRV